MKAYQIAIKGPHDDRWQLRAHGARHSLEETVAIEERLQAQGFRTKRLPC